MCELDIIFNFEKAYFILDEFLLGGEPQETSKKNVLKAIEQADLLQEVNMFSHVFSFHLSNSKGSRHVDGLAFSNLLWLPSAVYFQVCHASMINISLSNPPSCQSYLLSTELLPGDLFIAKRVVRL